MCSQDPSQTCSNVAAYPPVPPLNPILSKAKIHKPQGFQSVLNVRSRISFTARRSSTLRSTHRPSPRNVSPSVFAPGACTCSNVVAARMQTTPRGFEPLRAEPNGFLVHHLNHSVTVSMYQMILGSTRVVAARLLARFHLHDKPMRRYRRAMACSRRGCS